MTDFAHIEYGSTGLAVRDVQARLTSLGYDLGDEVARSIFGNLTAQATSAFRQKAGLPLGEDVDLETWNALVNETFIFGDRLLYLRLPHFHGRDVFTLQTALAALGFPCIADGIFGAHTEQAVREFQLNAGLSNDGIAGHSTFLAINRLRHAWGGKKSLNYEARTLGYARAAEVLERASICIFGEDELAMRIAGRISNLAMATNPASRVVSVQSTMQMPDNPALMIQLTTSGSKVHEQTSIPLVIYDSDETINMRMATALDLAKTGRHRIVVYIAVPFSGDDFGKASEFDSLSRGDSEGRSKDTALSSRDEQHAAIALLDALCLSFS